MRLSKHFFLIIFLIIAVFIPNSCKKYKKGVVEVKYTINSGSGPEPYYYAKIVDDDLYEPNKEFEYKKSNDNRYTYTGYYWPEKSAKSLGYKYNCDNDGGQFRSQEGCNGTKPGEDGHWKDDGQNNGGGGSGSCTDSYVSPINNEDAQLDAYCGAAYAYRCKDGKPLSDPQVQAVCKYYNDMKEPGVPECPYCK